MERLQILNFVMIQEKHFLMTSLPERTATTGGITPLLWKTVFVPGKEEREQAPESMQIYHGLIIQIPSKG